MKKIELFNGNIMVKEIARQDEVSDKIEGLIIPKETYEDEQVSQGKVVVSNSDKIAVGDVVLFHRVMPVDVNLKLEGDKSPEVYFFILEKDIICKIIE